MPRPILLGIVGDSASGKTTLTRGLVRILGEHQVTHISGDHYHRYDRRQRAERGLTPLHPECNYLDILEQHLAHLRAGEPIVKPVYRHQDGRFGAAEYVHPAQFTIVEGLLGFHTAAMRDKYDVRVFLDPPEDLRRKWKVQRDCSRRGYTTDQVLEELDRREADAEAFIRPQRRHADIVISFMPGDRGDPEHLDARIAMRPGIVHPELSRVVGGGSGVVGARGGVVGGRSGVVGARGCVAGAGSGVAGAGSGVGGAGSGVVDAGSNGIAFTTRGSESSLWVPGTISSERSADIEEAVWDRMHFASHLRTERLGEFTVGTALHRSEPLAITQLLVLYHLVTARAAIALGAEHARVDLAPARSV